jgi:hypothetical protein
MRKRSLLLVLFLALCGPAQLIAQSRVIKGIVTSGDDNGGVPGVNVVIKGTNIGASTNAEGAYTLSVPDNLLKNGVLIYSFIGMKTAEVPIGNQSSITVRLQHDETSLDEVIISALGFKENADKRGATASKIEAKDIVRSGETGVINGMSGKAAGVQITRSAGDPGAGSYIQIRGQNTITGSTQPLVIVDGIPISNSSRGNPTIPVERYKS